MKDLSHEARLQVIAYHLDAVEKEAAKLDARGNVHAQQLLDCVGDAQWNLRRMGGPVPAKDRASVEVDT